MRAQEAGQTCDSNYKNIHVKTRRGPNVQCKDAEFNNVTMISSARVEMGRFSVRALIVGVPTSLAQMSSISKHLYFIQNNCCLRFIRSQSNTSSPVSLLMAEQCRHTSAQGPFVAGIQSSTVNYTPALFYETKDKVQYLKTLSRFKTQYSPKTMKQAGSVRERKSVVLKSLVYVL